MPGILHHLDKYVDKMKKKVNKKINRISHNSKFDTSNFKKSDKNSYWDNNDKPKRKKGVGEVLLTLFFWLLGGVLVIGTVMFANANIIFLIRKAICSKSEQSEKCKIEGETHDEANKFLDNLFPINCCKLPFGEDMNCPCNDPNKLTMDEVKELDNATSEQINAMEQNKQNGGDISPDKKLMSSCSATFPYDKFSYGKDKDKFGKKYINWFLKSLANTEIKLNTHLIGILKSRRLNGIDESVLMILVGTIFPLLLLFTYVYTFGRLVWEQVNGFISEVKAGEILTSIAIICSCFIGLGANWVISIFNVLSVSYKFLISPWLKNKPGVKNVINNHKEMLTALFALIFTIAVVVGLPSDREYIMAKITVALLFLKTTLIPGLDKLWKSKGEFFKLIGQIFNSENDATCGINEK